MLAILRPVKAESLLLLFFRKANTGAPASPTEGWISLGPYLLVPMKGSVRNSVSLCEKPSNCHTSQQDLFLTLFPLEERNGFDCSLESFP